MSFFHSYIGQYWFQMQWKCQDTSGLHALAWGLKSSPCPLECDVYYEFNVPFFLLEVDKLIFAVRPQEKHGRVANFPRSDFGNKNFMHRRVA